MAGKRPVFTENFSVNLSAIEVFLGPEGRSSYQRLLDRLLDVERVTKKVYPAPKIPKIIVK